MAAIGHLIVPVDVDGTRHCVKHGATTPKWRTVSIPNEDSPVTLFGAENDDKWDTLGGYFKFATCCLWKATVRFHATGYVAGLGVWSEVKVNGNRMGGQPPGTGDLGIYDVVVDLNALGLMGRPCGNIWDITALFVGTVEIVNVLFGPPGSLNTFTFNTPANSQFQPLI